MRLQLWLRLGKDQPQVVSITIHDPLFVTKYELANNTAGFSVDGTPTDCVKLALQGGLFTYKPELIISGINYGWNLGSDVFYSGTVAAAMEGALLGIPSIAVSLANREKTDYREPAALVRELIEKEDFFEHCNHGLININFPCSNKKDWKGLKITRLGKTVYDNKFESQESAFGTVYYWVSGSIVSDNEPESDLEAIKDGYVSITPMHSDLTDYEQMKIMIEYIHQKRSNK
jgi:5'-nucleotidase